MVILQGELLTNEFLLCTEPTIELLFGDHLASHAAQNLDVFFFLNLVSTNWLEQKNVLKKNIYFIPKDFCAMTIDRIPDIDVMKSHLYFSFANSPGSILYTTVGHR